MGGPNRRGRFRAFGLALAAVLAAAGGAHGAEPPPQSFEALGAEFARAALPALRTHCLECHSADLPEGELDLERFGTFDDVRRGAAAWVKVAEMLDNGEMPPKDARRMPPETKGRLRDWVGRYLDAEAIAGAGDPGPVVLRRLNNAQYTYTLHDLTGVDLQPAREFPADGAAGEGFTNAGNALAMSPALLSKYLDAGKAVAGHAVLLPDGLRFSPGATRRDWSDEALAAIRTFYDEFTEPGGATNVNLQGVVFDTNGGGRLPLEKYLAATIEFREPLAAGATTTGAVGRDRGLSPKYLQTVWEAMNGAGPSILLDGLRARWRSATPADAPALAAAFAPWQKALWKFNSVGHVGKVGGPTAWMEPVSPLSARQEFRFKVPEPARGGEVTITLTASDAGDGNARDLVVWERPRFVALGRPDLLLRDARRAGRDLAARRSRVFAGAADALRAAAELAEGGGAPGPNGVAPEVLDAWFGALGLTGGANEGPALAGRLTDVSGHDFVNGWGASETPLVIANASDRHVRVPGNLKAGGVAVHPSPTLRVVAAWRAPAAGVVRASAAVQHAHPECGNGVNWSLELRRGAFRRRLAAGVSERSKVIEVGPFDGLAVRAGDLLALAVGPRDGNHSCDLTDVELKVSEGRREWSLAGDVSPDILAGNPHADRLGNPGVWRFFTEAETSAGEDSVVPEGSLLALWQAAASRAEKDRLAVALQAMLAAGPPRSGEGPDASLYRRLASLRGPLFRGVVGSTADGPNDQADGEDAPTFGRGPGGEAVAPEGLCVKAPSVVAFRLPADLVEGYEFVATGALHPSNGGEGSVQLRALASASGPGVGVAPDAPLVADEGGPARRRIEKALADFRETFPPALCYNKIVPVDEVVTLTLFYREDHLVRRLLLDDAQAARLDRLWDELHFVGQDALALVDVFEQLMEYASQDADPKVFEPLRKPILASATAFRETLRRAEPKHVEAVADFAAKAYRRPLSGPEAEGLRVLYARLRGEGMPHEEAVRLLLARVFVAPAFLYRLEEAPAGTAPAPVSDFELASRLSYFLWSSAPDETLAAEAASGRLTDPAVLVGQARRMLRRPNARRLAAEFACQWLNVYEFDTHDEKSERHFPTFNALRGDMYEETVRFLTDLFQGDGSVLSVIDADHAFLNEALAAHYGVPGVTGPEWRRVEGARKFARGGVLAQATTLAKQSGASRTSPILRGNWVSEALLGERLPRPPKDVPPLPDDGAGADGLSVRQLVERHTSDPRCVNCHERIDPLGYALEGYDAVGRLQARDPAGPPIDTKSTLRDGREIDGLDGLRAYLLTDRRDALVRQFCRKLLGFSLGRAVTLSDKPLLDQMKRDLEADDFRVGAAVEAVVLSRQFREIRGRDDAHTGTE